MILVGYSLVLDNWVAGRPTLRSDLIHLKEDFSPADHPATPQSLAPMTTARTEGKAVQWEPSAHVSDATRPLQSITVTLSTPTLLERPERRVCEMKRLRHVFRTPTLPYPQCHGRQSARRTAYGRRWRKRAGPHLAIGTAACSGGVPLGNVACRKINSGGDQSGNRRRTGACDASPRPLSPPGGPSPASASAVCASSS